MMRTTSCIPLVAGLAIVSGAAVAQPMEVVTVEAARSALVGQSAYGVPIREVTIQSRVSYSDLDLTSAYGALQLENRIKETARSTCEQIKVAIPAEDSSEAACVKNAVDGAMQEAHKVIEAKRSAHSAN
jgi:UrcA family protein